MSDDLETDPFVGQLVLERYLVEALLGRGAMGRVYRANNVRLDRPVAIKVLHDHLVHDRTMVARFHREAKIAAKLSHPNVISVLDSGQAPDGRHVMVQDLAVGPSLSEMIAVSPARRRIIQVIGQILLGLEHAHSLGLIHRDLKPDNIIVELANDGTELPRIVDFGIAILTSPSGQGEQERLTASGIMMGTPIYMAPEQAQLDPYDHRADLFALGVILYEMIAGKPPFDGTAMEIAVSNMSRDAPPIARRAPGREVDPLLELFARKLMARKPDARLPSARAALDLLALVDRAPDDAALALGIMDTRRAFELITLPTPRR